MTEVSVPGEYKPDWVAPPGDTLQEILCDRVLSILDFSLRCSIRFEVVTSIVNGVRRIDRETAEKFEAVLGVDANFWMNLENDYQEYLATKKSRACKARK